MALRVSRCFGFQSFMALGVGGGGGGRVGFGFSLRIGCFWASRPVVGWFEKEFREGRCRAACLIVQEVYSCEEFCGDRMGLLAGFNRDSFT